MVIDSLAVSSSLVWQPLGSWSLFDIVGRPIIKNYLSKLPSQVFSRSYGKPLYPPYFASRHLSHERTGEDRRGQESSHFESSMTHRWTHGSSEQRIGDMRPMTCASGRSFSGFVEGFSH